MISLARNEIYCFFKRHFRLCLVFLIISVFFTVYVLFIYKEQESDKTPDIKVGLINEDESVYSELLTEYLSENKAILKYAVITQGTREEIETGFKAGELNAYIVIPPRLIENMSVLKNTAMEVVIAEENPVMNLIFTQVVRQYEKYIRAVEQNCQAMYEKMISDGYSESEAWSASEKLLLNLVLTIIGRESLFEYEEIKDLHAIPTVEYYFYALLSLLAIYGGLLSCYNIVRAEQEGVLKRNLSVMSKKQCIFGIILAGIIHGLFFLWPLFPLSIVLHISIRALGLFFLFYAAIAIILQIIIFFVIISTSVEYTKRFLSTLVVLFFFFFLAGGGLIPISYLPENFLYLSKLTPVYWLMILFCRGAA